MPVPPNCKCCSQVSLSDDDAPIPRPRGIAVIDRAGHHISTHGSQGLPKSEMRDEDKGET